MKASIVTSKGQIVIPSKLRREYGIRKGTRVHFYEVNGEYGLFLLLQNLLIRILVFLGQRGNLCVPSWRSKKRSVNCETICFR